jgi:hypothetical protein
MNILKDDQYVSIPRKQYEEMERIINEKKDINVQFSLVYYNNYTHSRWDCHPHIIELNEVIDKSKITEISEMIKTATNHVSNIKDNEISWRDTELKTIKSKWWYKLFVWLENINTFYLVVSK